MSLLDRWTELLETLSRHRMRTVLTALSVAWGIFVLVVLIGVGDGLRKGVAWQFRDDATNSVWISRVWNLLVGRLSGYDSFQNF